MALLASLLLSLCRALELQLWCVQLDVKNKETLIQTIDPLTGTRRSLLNTTDALVDPYSPAAYDPDTDRIFSISMASPSDKQQRELIGALLDNVPVVNTHLDHNEDVQILALTDPAWARDGWRPRTLLVNPLTRHNLLLLEDDGVSIVAQFSGDRQLLYRLGDGVAAPGPLAINAQKQKLYLLTVGAKVRSSDSRLLILTMNGKVIGNITTSANIRYIVHDEQADTIVFLASNATSSGGPTYGTLNPFSGKLTVLGTFPSGYFIPETLSQPAAYFGGLMSLILMDATSATLVTFNVTVGLSSAVKTSLPSGAPMPSLVYAKASRT